MRLEKTPDILKTGPRSVLAARSRSLVYAAMAAAALHMTACGGENPDDPDGGAGAGTGGTGGTETGGTGGTETGGNGGDGGSDPCASLTFNGLGSKVYEVGEDGSFTLSGLSGPDAQYNGMTFEIKDGAMFIDRARVGLEKVIYDNYQPGYGAIGDVSGVRPVVIDADRPYTEDTENGGCRLNLVDVDTDVLNDPQKRPVMKTPQGYFTTAFNVKENYEEVSDYELLPDRTQVRLDMLTTASQKNTVILGNSRPALTAAAHRDAEGHIVVNIAGTTDEGYGTDSILENLGCSASGLTFEAVPGEPNKRRTTTPSSLTSLPLTVAGLNDGLTDDTSSETLTVTETDLCSGVDYDDGLVCNGLETCNPANGNMVPGTPVSCTTNASCEEPAGTCSCDAGYLDSQVTPGTCVDDPCTPAPCNSHGSCSVDNADQADCACDTGFAEPDCGSCDTASGLYENDYPVCSPDVTPPNAPVITTGGGEPMIIQQANFTLDGTADADTDELWVRAVQTSTPGAGTILFDWQKINGYLPNNVNWQYNGNIAEEWKAYDYCFRAEDKANNQSGTDCININRTP